MGRRKSNEELLEQVLDRVKVFHEAPDLQFASYNMKYLCGILHGRGILCVTKNNPQDTSCNVVRRYTYGELWKVALNFDYKEATGEIDTLGKFYYRGYELPYITSDFSKLEKTNLDRKYRGCLKEFVKLFDTWEPRPEDF